MALSVKTDDSWQGGGFALLSGDGLQAVTSVTIENCLSKQLLNAQGQWGKVSHPFPVASTPSGDVLLGPDLVDHVPTELFILLRDQDGTELGKVFWDVMPSRTVGSATLEDVLAIHRGRAITTISSAPTRVPAQEDEPPPAVILDPPSPPPLEHPPPLEQPPPEPPPAPEPPLVRDTIQREESGMPRPPEGSSALLPLWMTIIFGGVFCSSICLVAAILAGWQGFAW